MVPEVEGSIPFIRPKISMLNDTDEVSFCYDGAMDYSLPFLGKTVHIKIDRPLGSMHPKHGYEYPLNYGFVPDTLAPDGAEVDAYVLGEKQPLTEYTGQCIAIIHRIDDDDDKLILCSEGKHFSDEEIRALTHFQEQYFQSEIIRKQQTA